VRQRKKMKMNLFLKKGTLEVLWKANVYYFYEQITALNPTKDIPMG